MLSNLTRLLTLALFLSAFLLFCCQPMVEKMVLPSLGGAAAVWTTCVLFFQAMLLAGYLYAWCLGRLGSMKAQLLTHVGIMALVFLALPIRFIGSAPAGNVSPVGWELLQLFRSVALPFFVVSTTAPLVQSWFSRTTDPAAKDPYFLYAASNAGSLLSLVLYPFVIEPRLGVAAQSRWWSVGYALLVVLVAISIARFWRTPNRVKTAEAVRSPSAAARLFWLAGSFVPSALMLAVTTHLSVNLASVPFLWTLPLAVYLLTFILAFGRHVRVSAEQVSRVAPALLLVLIPIFSAGPIRPTILYLGILTAHLALLLVGGLLCHTALAAGRPDPAHLTEYYVWIAFGGVLGGVFAAILAPSIFSTVLEYPLLAATLAFFRKPQDTRLSVWDLSFLAFLGALLAAWWGLSRQLGYGIKIEQVWAVAGYLSIAVVVFIFHRRRWLFAGILAALILVYALIVGPALELNERLHVARNFFGAKKVVFDSSANERKLLHGDTMHGIEGLDPERAGEPLSYYFRSGPLGDVMSITSDWPGQHIGVVGLGSGTIAAYTQPNRHITFFEIDPQVEVIAREYFSYLPRCGTGCDVVPGDGRLSIMNAADKGFDLLVLDAFNSDAIPAHLLSREAVEIYKQKLKPHGAILFHVSNRYLRIRELVTALAFEAKLPAFYRNDDNEGERGKARSMYVIAAMDVGSIRDLPEKRGWVPLAHFGEVEAWTDDYSNLWAILKWR